MFPGVGAFGVAEHHVAFVCGAKVGGQHRVLKFGAYHLMRFWKVVIRLAVKFKDAWVSSSVCSPFMTFFRCGIHSSGILNVGVLGFLSPPRLGGILREQFE